MIRAGVFQNRSRIPIRWYAELASRQGMSNMLTVPALTLLFICIVVGLGAAFVWMFWEIEQRISKPHQVPRPYRKSDRVR